ARPARPPYTARSDDPGRIADVAPWATARATPSRHLLVETVPRCWPKSVTHVPGLKCYLCPRTVPSLVLVPCPGPSSWSLVLVPRPGPSSWSLVLVPRPGPSSWSLVLVPPFLSRRPSSPGTQRDRGTRGRRARDLDQRPKT